MTPMPGDMRGRVFMHIGYHSLIRNGAAKVVGELKASGVTDILYVDMNLAGTVGHKTKVPLAISKVPKSGKDPLEELLNETARVGMNVWTCLQSDGRQMSKAAWLKRHEALFPKDANGRSYRYPHRRQKGGIYDLRSPIVMKYAKDMIREWAAFNKHGNLKGFRFNEIWAASAFDYNGDDIEDIERFVEKRFGEKPPEGFYAKHLPQKGWFAPGDKWWRRYVLFKQEVAYEWVKEITEFAHQQGFLVMTKPSGISSWGSGNGGSRKMDRLGDVMRIYLGRGSRQGVKPPRYVPRWQAHVRPNTVAALMLSKTRQSLGYFFSHILMGLPMDCFVYNRLAAFEKYGRDKKTNPGKKKQAPLEKNFPDLRERLKPLYAMVRRWGGGRLLSDVCVLTYSQYHQLRSPDRKGWGAHPKQYERNEFFLMDALAERRPVRMAQVEDMAALQGFNVLVFPQTSARFLSAEVYDKVVEYVRKGGIVVSVNARWSTARPDFTGEIGKSREFLGVDDPAKAPPVIERALGKGRVIHINCDYKEKETLVKLLNSAVERHYSPPVRGDGKIKIVAAIKKGGKLLLTLYRPDIADKAPLQSVVRVDVKRLGLAPGPYSVTTKEGKPILHNGAKSWTPANLLAGFTVKLGTAEQDRYEWIEVSQ